MATNDLADLHSALEVQLRDDDDGTGQDAPVWSSAEKDELIKQSVDLLWPRYKRPLDPENTTIVLADGDQYYDLPSGVMSIYRVDRIDGDGNFIGTMFGRAWEIVGDVLSGAGKLHISAVFANGGESLQLHGYGKYDTSTNLIPSDYRQLVLAQARSEAYRRVTADRARFNNWLVKNQRQNVSVNELLDMLREAQFEVQRLRATISPTYSRPAPAYKG